MTKLYSKLITHVLNLKRSPHRWEFMTAHLADHNIHATRFEAVDGNKLTEKEIVFSYDVTNNRTKYFWPLHPSEIGCYMSHRLSMQAFLNDSESDYLLLLEDDVEANELFSKHVEEWLSIVNKSNPTLLKLFTKRRIRGPKVTTVQGITVVRPNRIPLGCVAQLLNKAAAQKMLEFSGPFFRPIDVDYQLWWQHGIDVLCTKTSLFNEVSQKLGGSTIGGVSDLGMWGKAKRELGRSHFRVKLSVLSHLYRLINKLKEG